MDKRDRELIDAVEELRPYKDIIIIIFEKRIRQLEFDAFRYGPYPSSRDKNDMRINKNEEHYNRIIETKKIKNQLVTLFHEE